MKAPGGHDTRQARETLPPPEKRPGALDLGSVPLGVPVSPERDAGVRAPAGYWGDEFGLFGDSVPMRWVFEQIQLVAPTRSTVLITGESGTGKELVARAVHQLSPRKDRPFVPLNCAAIPRELAESELFGHARGAFTGATDRRIGKLAAADRGTLLIDEIGEMDLRVQAKLLRALETRTISPVGSNDEQPVDVRVVAATHRNLRSLVDDGKFREDLYHRLHVVHIDLPPLRQRRDDIPLLVAVFLRQLNREHGRNVQALSAAAVDGLFGHHWPGNVRELRNVLEGAVVLSRREVIEVSDLPADMGACKVHETAARLRPGTTLAELERDAIQQRLIQTGGSRRRTAELLGISTRTLLRKIREFGLDDPRRRTAPAPTRSPLPPDRLGNSAVPRPSSPRRSGPGTPTRGRPRSPG